MMGKTIPAINQTKIAKRILLCLILLMGLTSCSRPILESPVTINIINPTPNPDPTYTIQHNLEAKITLSSVMCSPKGLLVGVEISVIVSGGIPPYKITPPPPIFASPGEIIDINVTSADSLSYVIRYKVPDKCDFSNQELATPNLTETLTPIQSAQPEPTTTPAFTQCWDGIDNDNDGFIDLQDPECNNRTDNDEAR